MQNKGLVKFFAILFALVSIYSLTFTFVANKVKEEAKIFASGNPKKEIKYLDSIGKEKVFLNFFTYNEVKDNQKNSGGGQYIIKNTPWELWFKIYYDCAPLYDQMLSYHKRFPISPGEIQFWTAEMWSLLWNLWYFGIETKVVNDLSFSWATDSIDTYEKHPILHMAGVTQDLKDKKFFKGDFINVNPLEKLKSDINFFGYIESDSATRKYIDIMKRVVNFQ